MKRFVPLFATVGLLVACGDQSPLSPPDPAPDAPSQAKMTAKIKPGSGGPYEVGFTTFMLHDDSRGDRPIAVYVWYPADPGSIDESSPEAMYPLEPFLDREPLAPSSAFETYGLGRAYEEALPAQGPFPLIMHAPGWGGTAYSDGLFIGTELAKHGFVVVATTHWGDQATWWDVVPKNPAEPYDHLALAIYNRPRDVSFALDAMLARNVDGEDLLFGTMDPGMIVASGWSIGGYTAMVLVGGDDEVCDLADLFPGWPLPPGTCAPTYPDPRISMIIPLDGSNQLLHFYELARVNLPSMGIGEEWAMAGDWQARQHAAFTGHPAYRVDVLDTNHISFSNYCVVMDVWADEGFYSAELMEAYKAGYCGPEVLEGAEAYRIIVKYMLAFLTHDQRVLTPGHAITSEPNVEFFVTEKRSPRSIDAEWPDWYVYHIHQPGKAHAMAFKELVAMAEMDPTGPRPMDFAFRYLGRRGF